MSMIINPYRFGQVVVPHRLSRLIPLVPGNHSSGANEWGLSEIQLSETSFGTNLIPHPTATASAGILNRTNFPIDLLEGRPLEYAPNEMLESWWQASVPTPILPRFARHTARGSARGAQAPIVFVWAYSLDNGVTWLSRGIIDDSVAGPYADSETREYVLAQSAAKNQRSLARLWAINCTEGNGTPPEYLIFGEVAFATSPGGASITTGGLPIGQPQRLAPLSRASFAFDGLATTSAGARTTYYYGKAIGYYWPTPQPNIVECRLTAHTGDPGFMPRSGQIVWSSNGVDWNVAGSFSGQTGWTSGETRTFTVSS